ncbi:MAG: hypothetical protein ABIN04_08090 [Ginsengibacter sp.]
MTTYKTLLLASLLMLAFTGDSLAQQAYENTADILNVAEKYAKVSTTTFTASANTVAPNNISTDYPNLIKRFSHSFQDAGNQQWTETDNYLFVSFINKGKKARACFTKEGTMNYVITDCDPEQLPASLQQRVKTDYPGYSIFNAKEVNAYNTTTHQVILEDADRFITIISTNEGVEETNTVNKIKTGNLSK